MPGDSQRGRRSGDSGGFSFFFRFIGDPGKFPFFLNVKTWIPSIRAGPKVKAKRPQWNLSWILLELQLECTLTRIFLFSRRLRKRLLFLMD